MHLLLMSPKKFLNIHPKSILVLFQCICIFINNVNSLQSSINNTNSNNNQSNSQHHPPAFQLSNFDNSLNNTNNSDDIINSDNNKNNTVSDDSKRIIITTPKNSIPLLLSTNVSSDLSSITTTTTTSSPLNGIIENIDSVVVNESYENISYNNNNDSDRSLPLNSNNNNKHMINASVPEIINGTFRVPLGSLDVIIKEDVSYSDDSPDINDPQIHNLLENSKKIGDSCEGHQILPNVEQPQLTDFAKIKKCCPYGENYHYTTNGKNGSSSIKYDVPPSCAKETIKFNVSVVKALFYENCIEDTEEFIKLDYDVGNPCLGHSYLYNRLSGDLLYVLQNGSLLRIEENYDNYDVFDDYCLDMNGDDMILSAIVCDPIFGKMVHVSKAQSYIYAICMLTSVPCLLLTVFFYLAIPRLRNLHGKSLACHSMCLAIGFLLLSISQLNETIGQVTGYIVQYFILACFFWLTMMCLDICTQVWFFVPRRINLKPIFIWLQFIGYLIISMGIPLILVLTTYFKQLPGTPSYYLKGMTEATRSSQQFFIPPISSLLIVCFLLLIASFFGFRELNGIVSQSFIIRMNAKRNPSTNVNHINSYEFENFEEVKQVAKGTAYLYAIMTINWIFEIISFYHDSSSDSLVLFDILNALQGVVIFIIFVCLPYQLKIIKHWWTDRGEFHITNMTELQELNKKSTTMATTEHTDLESNNKIIVD